MENGEKDLFPLLIPEVGWDGSCLNSHFSAGNLTKEGGDDWHGEFGARISREVMGSGWW